MDPLTITSAVIAVSARCVSTAQALYSLREKYGQAKMMISAIYSESTVISASLGHIQGLVSRDPDAIRSTLQSRPELERTFDQALTGCVLVFSVLEDEVQKLHDGIDTVMGRAKYVWREQTMKELLQQIRGQQTALSLLIQALQMTSILDVKSLLMTNNTVLMHVAQRTNRFRTENPKVRAPASVLNATTDDGASILSYHSTATSTNFAFDDLLVNSQAYRRVSAQSRRNINQGNPPQRAGNPIPPAESVAIVPDSVSNDNGSEFIPASIRQKLSKDELSTLIAGYRKASSTISLMQAEQAEHRQLQVDYQALSESLKKFRHDYFMKDYLMQELKRTQAERIKELERTHAERITQLERAQAERIMILELEHEALIKERCEPLHERLEIQRLTIESVKAEMRSLEDHFEDETSLVVENRRLQNRCRELEKLEGEIARLRAGVRGEAAIAERQGSFTKWPTPVFRSARDDECRPGDIRHPITRRPEGLIIWPDTTEH